MFGAMMDAVSAQLSLQFGSSVTTTQQIKFDRYVYWLESKLNSVSSFELSELDNIVDQLSENIAVLKAINAQCRSTMIAYNAAQVNRIHKLYDLVDSLAEPFFTGRLFVSYSVINATKYSITSILPDADVLREIIAENRLKLKSIDEIASSKKSEVVKFKATKATPTNKSDNKKANEIQLIRTEVKNILGLLDLLAAEVEKHSIVLRNYAQLKQLVHFPLQVLSTHLRSLPPLAETSAQLDHDLQALNKVEAYYTMLRRAEILVQAAATRQEARYIEALVKEDVVWLGLLAEKGLSSSIHEINKGLANFESDTVWSEYLQTFCKLSLPDLLCLCGTSKGSEAFQLCVHSLRELLNRLKKNHPLFGALPAQVRSLLAAFDVELFCAHAQDYCERGSIYESLLKRVEFARAYEHLCEGRKAMDKAQRKYELTSALFEEYLVLHRDANAQLAQLKDRCIEIALAEVSELIEFIV